MKRSQFISLFLVFALLFSLTAGCSGLSRVESFFSNNEYQDHAKIIDFGLFFVMFFGIAYLGLTKVWGEGYGKGGSGKGAIVGVSLALALALAFAIVTQTQFSITTIFPIAKALLFIIIWFILWGLLNMSKVFGDHWGGKVVTAILAFIAIYLIATIGTHMICQMQNNLEDPACESDFFNFGITYGERAWEWLFGKSDGDNNKPNDNSDGGSNGGSNDDEDLPDRNIGTEIKGGCRLDITFELNSVDIITGESNIEELVQALRTNNIHQVHVYGFASTEGAEKLNSNLARNRANKVQELLRGVDVLPLRDSIGTSVHVKGETRDFSTELPQNRRVVISTEPISEHFAPAPPAGAAYHCPDISPSDEDLDELCGNGLFDIMTEGELCDPTASGANGCDDGQRCREDCRGCVPDDVGDDGEPIDPNENPNEPGEEPSEEPEESSSMPGWLKWIGIILLILLLGFGLWHGGFSGYYRIQKMRGKIPNYVGQLRQILQQIRNLLKQMKDYGFPQPISPTDQTKWRNAIAPTKMKKRNAPKKIKQLFDDPAFLAGLTPQQRDNARQNTANVVKRHREASKLLDKILGFWLMPKQQSIHRMQKKLNKIIVSPLVHTNKEITFAFEDKSPLMNVISVRVFIEQAPTGNQIIPSTPTINDTLTPRKGQPGVFDVRTNILQGSPRGTYSYEFEITRSGPGAPNTVTRIKDPLNQLGNRTSSHVSLP